MHFLKYSIALSMLLLGTVSARSQEYSAALNTINICHSACEDFTPEETATADSPESETSEIVVASIDRLREMQGESDIAESSLDAPWRRHIYLKTDLVGCGLAMANLALEFDLARHCSLVLPFYYSAWDYFKPTLKFRIMSIRPEFRFWISKDNDGLFAGVHGGPVWYNFAFDGEYRTQDHDGNSPALGGGLAVGYRMPISHNGRWKVEFSLGAGAYVLNHDHFRNVPNGLLTDTVEKTWFGLDQAAISFSYTFNTGRNKGGRR